MKKLALLSLAAAALALPTVASAQTPAPAAPAASAAAPAMAAPAAAAPAMASKKVELKDGSWAEVTAAGAVSVSKDGGKTWTPAPDGTWEAKDGSKITTKGGKEVK